MIFSINLTSELPSRTDDSVIYEKNKRYSFFLQYPAPNGRCHIHMIISHVSCKMLLKIIYNHISTIEPPPRTQTQNAKTIGHECASAENVTSNRIYDANCYFLFFFYYYYPFLVLVRSATASVLQPIQLKHTRDVKHTHESPHRKERQQMKKIK